MRAFSSRLLEFAGKGFAAFLFVMGFHLSLYFVLVTAIPSYASMPLSQTQKLLFLAGGVSGMLHAVCYMKRLFGAAFVCLLVVIMVVVLMRQGWWAEKTIVTAVLLAYSVVVMMEMRRGQQGGMTNVSPKV